ncbi:MAG TPA: class I SAM-dependent methyltransferase [Pyrinomonadaceae bacterium]|jgi:SAM-dependent methyltransferase
MTQTTHDPDILSTLSAKQRALLELRLRRRRDQAPLPVKSDDENLLLAASVERVDELLSKFYGRFPWPWPAMKFDYLEDLYFETAMLNQDVGSWRHRALPRDPEIWVAGCGTNQAIHTALRFRNGRVVGSDVSARSLEICGRNARAVGLTNLELKEESINHVPYRERFDYVACTGVIHHNADPRATLEKIAAALRPDGVLELMVYNRFHRLITSSFQKAVRIFGEGRAEAADFDAELALARKIVGSISVRKTLERAFIQFMDFSESDFADLLIQPVEHSYTVESLADLAADCGLELVAPCISPYAKNLATYMWNLSFDDPELQGRYDALPDARRWQVTNLLLSDKSPLLWFYLRRRDSGRWGKTEAEVNEEFLSARFEKTRTTQRSYIRADEATYRPSPAAVPYPLAAPDESVRPVFEAADGRLTMREVLARAGVAPTFGAVSEIRTKLTTAAFPYLRSVTEEAA